MSTYVDTLLAEVTQPLLDALAGTEEEIQKAEAQLREHRESRKRLVAVIRGINPDLLPTKGKKETQKNSISQAKLDDITTWLQRNAETLNNNGGFHATGLAQEPGFPLTYQSGVSKALKILHEEGIIRLDHTGTGGAKYFKVVA